jgi:diadenosine tetraphosphatase ApaH/serine/threonine PP2A family protein phosphatase
VRQEHLVLAETVLRNIEKAVLPETGVLLELLYRIERVIAREPTLLQLDGPVAVVGDTHGDLEASSAAVGKYLERFKLVFLGDYVDRGGRSLENASYLLALKLLHPRRVFLLRGNHESMLVNQRYGFYYELAKKVPERAFELFVRFNEVFSNLPYAALLKPHRLLLLHGGIPDTLPKLRELEMLPRKDLIPTDKTAFQLLWNDPSENIESFEPSDRGEGIYFFGRKPAQAFLEKNKLSGIIRSHEVVEEGYRFNFPRREKEEGSRSSFGFRKPKPPKGFKGLVLTVFSSGAYENVKRAVAVFERGELRVESL